MASLTPLEQQQLGVAPAPTFWHRVRFDLVTRHLGGRTTVLDIGAGSGLLGDHLVPIGITYRFDDSSPTLREALVARFGATGADDGGPIGSDVTVTLLDVLEHDEDDIAVLSEIADRMMPGAGLIVTVPALAWLFSSWDVDLGHHRRYSRRGATRLVERAGFTVVDAGYLFPELVVPAWARRWRRSTGETAEFPDLPGWVDRSAERVSRFTSRGRRWMPVGTSVIVVAQRSGTS